mmetsp:Transcript_84407/g.217380  ORF Transcript_84407/g.217380 Transcript_84407/m.217380 type:complete len:706 (-) Transcript_84407:229-2346(-)
MDRRDVRCTLVDHGVVALIPLHTLGDKGRHLDGLALRRLLRHRRGLRDGHRHLLSDELQEVDDLVRVPEAEPGERLPEAHLDRVRVLWRFREHGLVRAVVAHAEHRGEGVAGLLLREARRADDEAFLYLQRRHLHNLVPLADLARQIPQRERELVSQLLRLEGAVLLITLTEVPDDRGGLDLDVRSWRAPGEQLHHRADLLHPGHIRVRIEVLPRVVRLFRVCHEAMLSDEGEGLKHAEVLLQEGCIAPAHNVDAQVLALVQLSHDLQELLGRRRVLGPALEAAQGAVVVQEEGLRPGPAREECLGGIVFQELQRHGLRPRQLRAQRILQRGEDAPGPGHSIVFPNALAHPLGDLPSLALVQDVTSDQIQADPDGIRNGVLVVRVHHEGVEQLLRRAGQLREHDRARHGPQLLCLGVLGHEVLLRNQVHAVNQWGHEADVSTGIQGRELVHRDGAVDVHDRLVRGSGELAVNGADGPVHLLLNALVLLDFLAGGHGDEEEDRLRVVHRVVLLGIVAQRPAQQVCERGADSPQGAFGHCGALPPSFEALLEGLQAFSTPLERGVLWRRIPLKALRRGLLVLLGRLLFCPHVLEVALDCRQLLRQAFGVVQPLHGEDQALALELLRVRCEVLLEVLALHGLLDALPVRADGEHAQLRPLAQVIHVVHLWREPAQPDNAGPEVPEVAVGVEADEVSAEHALNNLGTLR